MPKDNKDPFKKAEKAAAGKSHLMILIDESGSMQFTHEAVITGVNRFLKTFRDSAGRTRVTIGFFDQNPGSPRTRYHVEHAKIEKVADLAASDFRPRGMTPLYDAILDVIARGMGATKEDEAPFLAIVTDGNENASEASQETVQDAIAKVEKAGWGVVYVGANQDAHKVAHGLGLRGAGQSFNYTASAVGTRSTMDTVAELATSRAAAGPGGQGAAGYRAEADALAAKTGGKIPETDPDEAGDDTAA